jgi:hypothetical protein
MGVPDVATRCRTCDEGTKSRVGGAERHAQGAERTLEVRRGGEVVQG